MKKAIFLITIFVLLISSVAFSFEGYERYPMLGNTIYPLTDVDVKLSEVNIQTNKDSSEIVSTFVLENLTNEQQTFKVAFPIVSNCIGDCTAMPPDFVVTIDGRQIGTTLSTLGKTLFVRMRAIVSEDAAKQYKFEKEKAIIWEVALKPKERKAVTCRYSLNWYFEPPQEVLMVDLTPTILWKGNIDKVHFRLYLPKLVKAAVASKTARVKIQPPTGAEGNRDFIEWNFKNLDLRKRDKSNVRILGVYVWYSSREHE